MKKPLLHAVAETYSFAWTHKKSFLALFREWFLAGLGVIALLLCILGLLVIARSADGTATLSDYYNNLPFPLLAILVLSLITLVILMSGFLLVGIVRCHRLYILGELDTQWRWGWRGHEWLYAKRMFVSFFWIMLWCIPLFAILIPLLLTPLLLLLGISLATSSVFVKTLIVLPIQITTLYLVSRYCLSLVGGAVGEFIPLKESIRLAAPHRWRITLHSLLLIFPTLILSEATYAAEWEIISYTSEVFFSILSIALGAFVYSHYYVKLKLNEENTH